MDFRIAIVDDTSSDMARLRSFIHDWFYGKEHKLCQIVSYGSGEEMLKSFEPKKFQVVFMDIIMKNLNGVETARQLRNMDTELLIVFMTTSREYAFEAFPVHPFDYVLKPYRKNDVEKILDEVERVLTAYDPTVKIKIAHSEREIPMRLIISAVSNSHTVEISLVNGEILVSTMKFKEIEKLLAEDARFLLCNRGVIVNMPQILAQEHGVFVMKNGARYPIKVTGQSKITSKFSQYLISNMRAENIFPAMPGENLHTKKGYDY